MPLETIDSPDKNSLKPLVGSLLSKVDDLLAEINALHARIAELAAPPG